MTWLTGRTIELEHFVTKCRRLSFEICKGNRGSARGQHHVGVMRAVFDDDKLCRALHEP